MAIIYNYYWDNSDPAKPFTRKVVCNAFTIVPDIATRIAPPKCDKGTVACWTGKEWVVRADWRQEIVYDVKTGQRVSYPTVDIDETHFKQHYTTLKPTSQLDTWNGKKWVVDPEEKRKKALDNFIKCKNEAIGLSKTQIDMIRDAISYLVGSGNDFSRYSALLEEWKRYRGQWLTMRVSFEEKDYPVQPECVESING